MFTMTGDEFVAIYRDVELLVFDDLLDKSILYTIKGTYSVWTAGVRQQERRRSRSSLR